MPRPKKKLNKKSKRMPRIPPHSPTARDEGPRLIPLDQQPEPSNTEHFVKLADILLGGRGRKKSS